MLELIFSSYLIYAREFHHLLWSYIPIIGILLQAKCNHKFETTCVSCWILHLFCKETLYQAEFLIWLFVKLLKSLTTLGLNWIFFHFVWCLQLTLRCNHTKNMYALVYFIIIAADNLFFCFLLFFLGFFISNQLSLYINLYTNVCTYIYGSIM